ncbi:MarR family winged helix-turn-helix transcriptional regulator [Methylophaga sp. OBS4]|uniref:MarR family winged helix-turn-helix transcriptional regulator n=1 Tax=Methylophaga sp. OBS4 TaxID=2991935 RepID=UPI002256CF0A|nr:MarR family transcriptional regulator [Methylophaga sp. OBS4]MCX4187487.1 MarR family transcriptional regulator [Methylophaga sp. OBS4]
MGPILKDQVCYALYSTSGIVTQAYSSLLKRLKLTYPQFVVMMALWQKDGVSVTTLAHQVGISKATLSPMLKNLEASGFLYRNTVPGNDRVKSIVLTELGTKSVTEGETIAKAALCATGLSDEEAATLIGLCNKIKNNLR